MNRPPYGDALRRATIQNKMLEVTSQILPNKTVKVAPGTYTRNGNEIVEFIGANTAEIAAPLTGAKWVLISLNSSNTVLVTNGDASTNSPPMPVIVSNTLPLALIYYKSIDTVITSDMVYDIRPFFSIYFETVEKVSLVDFNTTLAILTETLNNSILNKADSDGTVESEFTLNKEETGALSSDALISVNRGSTTKVSIKWNEGSDKWQYTNDGITFVDFGSSWDTAYASIANFGNVKLSSAPTDPLNPIAVSDTDSRLFTLLEKGNVLAHTNLVNADPHNTLSLLTASNLPVHSHVIGITNLDATLSAFVNNAVLTSDTRLFATEAEKLSVLAHTTSVNSDPHNTLGLLTAANLPHHGHVLADLDAVTSGLISNSVQTTDTRLFATAAEKQAVLDHVNAVIPSQSIQLTDLSPSVISKFAEVDANETIVGVYTFSPGVPHAPFIIGLNAMGHLVPGLNADKLQGKTPSDFVSSSDATNSIILVDGDITSNKYKLEVRSGVLIITPVL